MKEVITVQTLVLAPIAKVWECWNKPEYITGWAFASNDWEAPAAENDLRFGGRFKTVMAEKTKVRVLTSQEFTLLLKKMSLSSMTWTTAGM